MSLDENAQRYNMIRNMVLDAAADICAKRAARYYQPLVDHRPTDLELARRAEAEECASDIRALIRTDEEYEADIRAMGNAKA